LPLMLSVIIGYFSFQSSEAQGARVACKQTQVY